MAGMEHHSQQPGEDLELRKKVAAGTSYGGVLGAVSINIYFFGCHFLCQLQIFSNIS